MDDTVNFGISVFNLPFSLLDLLSCYELTARKSTSVSSVFVCPENSSVHRVSPPARPR